MDNSITNFKVGFDSKYQDIFGKSLTAKKIANFRLESQLSWGKSVDRAKLVLDAVKVRAITRQVDRTIDAISDGKDTLTVNKQFGASFPIDDWDELQSGPLKTGENAGREIALKVKRFVDADVFNEVTNAYATFGDGDIGGTAGNPITLSTTNAVQVITTLLAKLQANNQENNGDFVIVMDPYMASIINQTVIGKSIEMAGTALKNGYAGPLVGFQTYISNNLKGTATLNVATTATAGDTVTINGVVFTFQAAVGATAGNVVLGANATASRQNLIAAINGAAGAGTTYVEVSTANRTILDNSRITATESGTEILLVGVGASRLTLAETLTAAADVWSKNMIHCYAGRKSQIDVVMQQDVKTTFRDEPKQRTTNVLIDALYGIKTFPDGAQQFLDLQIAR